ncbi:unnamed protein product [Meganyctiphanes norvegica]|uniref:WW domain-containing protein n=1 Tax=Meganyctiphanes norvegica TaxID=48144 RepID=A0AAV2S5S2_MEGNR
MLGKRYSTSKCHSLHDLNTNLGQYGFRGEAVASLVDVAGIVDVTTKHRSSTDTYTKLFAYGKEKSLQRSKVPRPSFGTTVTVQDFMYNMPVRRKRIKETIEIENIRIRLESFALMHPEISFSLRNDLKNEKVMQTHKGKNAITAFMQLYGHDRAQSLVEVFHTRDQFEINGYISIQPYINKSLQYIYINKRVVLKTKVHSLMNDLLSHSSIISKKLHPVGVSVGSSGSGKAPSSPSKGLKLYGIFILNIECPFEEYDICIDPSKTLVEFRDWHKLLLTVEEWVIKFCQEENIVISLDERYRRSGKEDNIPEEEISPSQPHSSQEKLQIFSLKRPGDKSSNKSLVKEKYGRTITIHDFQSVVTSLPARRIKKTVMLDDDQNVEEISDEVMGEISVFKNDVQQASPTYEDSRNESIDNAPKNFEHKKNMVLGEWSSSQETELNQSSYIIEEHSNQTLSFQNKNGKRNIPQESEFHLRKKNIAKSSLDLIRQIVGSEDTIEEFSTSHSSCEVSLDNEYENNEIRKDLLNQNEPKLCDETLSLTPTPYKRQGEELSKQKSEKKISSLEAFRQFHQTHLINLNEAPTLTPVESIIRTPDAPPPITTKSLSSDSDNDCSKNKLTSNIFKTKPENKTIDHKYSEMSKNRLRRDVQDRGFERFFNDSDEEELKQDNLIGDKKEKTMQKDDSRNNFTASRVKDKKSVKGTRTLSSVLKEGLRKQQQKEKALNSLQKFQFKKGQTSKDAISTNNSNEQNNLNKNAKESKISSCSSSSNYEQKSFLNNLKYFHNKKCNREDELLPHNNEKSSDESFHFSPVISIKTNSTELNKDDLQTRCQSRVQFDFSAIHENIPNTVAEIHANNPETNHNNSNLLGSTVSSALPILSSNVRTEIVAEIDLNDAESNKDVNYLLPSFIQSSEKKSVETEQKMHYHKLDSMMCQSSSEYANIPNGIKEHMDRYNKSKLHHNSQPDLQDTQICEQNCSFEPSQGFLVPMTERQHIEDGKHLNVLKNSNICGENISHQMFAESQGFSFDKITKTNPRNNSQFTESEGFSIDLIKPTNNVNNLKIPSNIQICSSPLDQQTNICERVHSSNENSFSSIEKSHFSTIITASELKRNEGETNFHEPFIENGKTDCTVNVSLSSFKESRKIPINDKFSSSDNIKQTKNVNNIIDKNSIEMGSATVNQDNSEPCLSDSIPSLHFSQLIYPESSKNNSESLSSQISNEKSCVNLNDLLGSFSPKTISFGSQQIQYERDKCYSNQTVCKENLDLSLEKTLQCKKLKNDSIESNQNNSNESNKNESNESNKDESNESNNSQNNSVMNLSESTNTLLSSSDSQISESFENKSHENSNKPNFCEDYDLQKQKQKTSDQSITQKPDTSEESKSLKCEGKNVWKETVDDSGRKVYINLLNGNSSYDPPVIPETPEPCSSQGMSEPPLRIPISDEPWFEQLEKNKNKCNDFVLSHGYSAFMSFKKRRELAAKENNTNKSFDNKETKEIGNILEHEKSEDNTGSCLSSETKDALQAFLLENDNEEESIKWVDKPSSLSKSTEKESNIAKICQLWEAPNFAMDSNIAATESVSTEQAAHKKNSAIRVYNIVHPYKFTRVMLQSCVVLGQLDKKFIACNMKYDPTVYIDALDKQVRDIIVLFDQHAVHERVRLENILIDNHELLPSGDKAICSALVTPPMEMYLQGNEVRLMEAYSDIFQRFGLQYVKVNSTKVTFHAIPSCLVARDASEMRHRRCQTASTIVETLVREVCHTVHETGGIAPRLPKSLSHVLNSQACRGAVKFGDELTHNECCELIESLSKCQLPFQCAHGRPSIVPIVDMTHMAKFSVRTAKPNIKRFAKRMQDTYDQVKYENSQVKS